MSRITKEEWKKAEDAWRGERGAVINTEDHESMQVKRYDFANLFTENKLVLDLGCGSGYGSAILSKKAWCVHGIDKTADAIDFAKRHYSKGNVEWFNEDFPPILKKEKTYGVVVCHEVVEHIDDDVGLLKEIKRVMEDNGIFIGTTPIKKEHESPAKWHIREYSMKEYKILLKRVFSEVDVIYFDHNKSMGICKK